MPFSVDVRNLSGCAVPTVIELCGWRFDSTCFESFLINILVQPESPMAEFTVNWWGACESDLLDKVTF